MTPFFGVSLYIWSGILSITLIFLAIGYRVGGNYASKNSKSSVEYALLAAPIASALAIAISTAAYPLVFPILSQINLIVGSFVGATLLLALPLIALSAMNPLLISLGMDNKKGGDGGAGRVFFISTMGSVIGVLLTAFMFIPNMTNFRAILILGISISIVTVIFMFFSKDVDVEKKPRLLIASLLSCALCAVLFITKDSYLKLISSAYANSSTFNVIAEYTSMFGNIKVAEVKNADGSGEAEKYFLQDGLIQNRTTLENKSVSMYTYVLESLAHSYVPDAKDVLVLGLGAGILPRHFKDESINVSVVEINSVALSAARTNFGFDPENINIHLEDARTYVRACNQNYDVVVVDLFQGDNIPDYLMTKEFFSDLRKCVRSRGAVVMNTFFDSNDDEPNRRLLATLGSAFSNIFISGINGGNIFLVGTSESSPKILSVEAKELSGQLKNLVEFSVSGSKKVSRDYFKYSNPISDEHNIFSLLFADANITQRQYLSGILPPHVLVN